MIKGIIVEYLGFVDPGGSEGRMQGDAGLRNNPMSTEAYH
jgi:hypothetical protein